MYIHTFIGNKQSPNTVYWQQATLATGAYMHINTIHINIYTHVYLQQTTVVTGAYMHIDTIHINTYTHVYLQQATVVTGGARIARLDGRRMLDRLV